MKVAWSRSSLPHWEVPNNPALTAADLETKDVGAHMRGMHEACTLKDLRGLPIMGEWESSGEMARYEPIYVTEDWYGDRGVSDMHTH